MFDALHHLIDAPDARDRDRVSATLERFGPGALRYARAAGMRIVVLRPRQRFRDASAALRRLDIDVDAWQSPPAGLFVVEERRVYLRAVGAMTVAHEFGHALDCALGNGIYRSGVDPRIRHAFGKARAYITPYAASGVDEYFAEAMRAWVDANDEDSTWPPATRKRLWAIDPCMAAIVASLFAIEFAP